MIGNDIEYAAELLSGGELVAIPTETVYGLAGNAFNSRAVSRIFAVKERPSFDPLIVHTSSADQIPDLVSELPKQAELLINKFMPGPLTVLLKKRAIIPDLVTSGLERVAIRIPKHPLTLKLLSQLDFPLAAPSANPFGYISPTTAQHVEDQLGNKIPYILDGGQATVGLESTIVGFENGKAIIYRKGGLSIDAIRAVIGDVYVREFSTSNPATPGMLISHYAPGAPVILGTIPALIKKYSHKKLGTISLNTLVDSIPRERQLILSERQDMEEAARNLFAGMRYLDRLHLDLIIAELVPEKGLGLAINDRLRRAAGGN